MSQAVRQAQQAARKVVRELDAQIAEVEKEARARVTELKREKARWEGIIASDRRRKATSTQIAGPKAIHDVEQYLIEHGPTFQADLGAELGLNSGTVTHALRALASDGKVLSTGNVRRGSPEFQHTGAAVPEPVAA